MHIKGEKFGFAPVQRIGVLNDRKVHFVKWNTHPGCEIHYIAKGNLIWEIGREANKVTVTGGRFIVIPSNTRHRASENLGSPSVRVGVILSSAAMPGVSAGSAFSQDELSLIISRIEKKSDGPHKITKELARVLSALSKESLAFRKKGHGDRFRMRALCDLLLCETMNACESDERDERDGETPSRLAEVYDWIEKHISEMISNDTLVDISRLGRSRFFSIFHAETGTTPHNFILQKKIKKAKEMILSRDGKSLGAIAAETGFSSVSAMTAVFRRFLGVGPKELRSKR